MYSCDGQGGKGKSARRVRFRAIRTAAGGGNPRARTWWAEAVAAARRRIAAAAGWMADGSSVAAGLDTTRRRVAAEVAAAARSSRPAAAEQSLRDRLSGGPRQACGLTRVVGRDRRGRSARRRVVGPAVRVVRRLLRLRDGGASRAEGHGIDVAPDDGRRPDHLELARVVLHLDALPLRHVLHQQGRVDAAAGPDVEPTADPT